MAALQWDVVGERTYETGVDHGVLYLPDTAGDYIYGYAWNGLTTVTESPEGAEASPQYADNIKYLNIISAEEFGATIEAFTYPNEFAQCDGTAQPQPGVNIGQQSRRLFGMSYRTQLGNDLAGTDYGYKLHLIYGAQAAPSEKAYGTVNDSPEAIAFSWEVKSTPIAVPNLKPTSQIVLDSSKATATMMTNLQTILYGAEGINPRLPPPSEVLTLFTGTTTIVRMTGSNAPAYNSTTKVVTLPTVTGVQWKIDGVNKTPGAQPALTSGQTSVVTAHALAGYMITGEDTWVYDF